MRSLQKWILLVILSNGICTEAETCSIQEILQSEQNSRFETSVQKVKLKNNSFLIAFSQHRSDSHQQKFEQIVNALEKSQTATERKDFSQKLQKLLFISREEISRSQKNIDYYKKLNSKLPLKYIGLELPPYLAEDYEVLLRRMGILENDLRAKTELSEKEIQQLLILLAGDEFYLLIPGKSFAHTKRIYTENDKVHKKWFADRKVCREAIAMLKPFSEMSEKVSIEHKKIGELFLPDLANPDSEKILNKSIPAIIQNLDELQILNDAQLKAFHENLRKCHSIHSVERDVETAKILNRVTSEENGLVFRGLQHKFSLPQLLINQCNASLQNQLPTAPSGVTK